MTGSRPATTAVPPTVLDTAPRAPEATAATPAATLAQGAPLWRWERTLTPSLARYARELLDGPWMNLRLHATATAVGPIVHQHLADHGLAARSEQRELAGDVAMLAELLSGITGCAEVEIRVEQDLSARCPVFHHDNNVVRLLCTYAGPGTEWLPEAHLDRTQLGLQGRCPDDANAAIARREPQRARPGEVLVIKGRQYAIGHPTLVHKSPAPDLGARLLVALDPVAMSRTG